MQIKDIGNSHGIVYHYTKLEHVLNIITEDGLLFHAGRCDSMNDPDDSMHALHNFESILSSKGMEGFTDTFDGNFSSYLVSFSKSEDCFDMWRSYNADIMLHIDSDVIKEDWKNKTNSIYMDEIQYSEDGLLYKKAMKLYVESMRVPCGLPEKIFNAKILMSFIKPNDFRMENEWRIACFDDFDMVEGTGAQKVVADEVCSEIKVKGVKYDCIHFYRQLKLPQKCLKGITLRPNDNSHYGHLCMQLRLWLAQMNYDVENITINRTKTSNIR